MANKGKIGICDKHGEFFMDSEDSPCPACEDGEPEQATARTRTAHDEQYNDNFVQGELF